MTTQHMILQGLEEQQDSASDVKSCMTTAAAEEDEVSRAESSHDVLGEPLLLA